MKRNAINRKVTLGVLSAFLSLNIIVGCAPTQEQRPDDKSGLNVPKPNADDAQGLYKYAQALERSGKEKEAIDFYLQATQVQPSHLEAHIALAQLYTKFNRIEEAKVAYENVLKLDRTHPFIEDYKNAKLKYFSARNIAQNGEYERALKLLVDAPSGTPLDKEINETRENWRKQLQESIRSKIVEDKIQQASLLAYKGDYAKAIEELLTAPDADSNPVIQQKIARWKEAMQEQRNQPNNTYVPPQAPVVQSNPVDTTPSTPAYSITRYITGDTVNMRSAPSLSARVVATLRQGSLVTVTSSQVVPASGYNWYQVQTGSGQSGWVASQFLGTSSSSPVVSSAPPVTIDTTVSPDSTGGSRYITADQINIRIAPSINSSVIAKAVKNERVTLVSNQQVPANGYVWIPIQLVNGTRGWIASRFLSSANYGNGSFATPSTSVTRYISGGLVNIRSRASLNSPVVYQARNGMAVQVISNPLRNSGYTWYKVTLPNGQSGWVADSYLR